MLDLCTVWMWAVFPIFRGQMLLPSTSFTWLGRVSVHVYVYIHKKVKLSLCLIKHYAMKAYGGVDVYIHNLLTSALVGGEWWASRLCRFTTGGAPVPLYRLGGPQSRSGLVKRKFLTLPGLEPRPLGRPACSQSLYRLAEERRGLVPGPAIRDNGHVKSIATAPFWGNRG
jgi:hypothetical protein